MRVPSNEESILAKIGASSSSQPSNIEERIPSSSSQGIKPRWKCWKASKKIKKMVVGDDVSMEEILELIGKTSGGHFCGKVVCPKALGNWIDKNWTEPLGYRPGFHTLSRGWICFKFHSREDLNNIFNRTWGWGPSDLVLKEWSVAFDLARDPKHLPKFGRYCQTCR
jgi:hypothetical protein